MRMITFAIHLLFFSSTLEADKTMHYRLVSIKGKKGCVQASVSQEKAQRFQATPGKCSDVSCLKYQGEIYIPFCCFVTGFLC